jgi:hypothetical protein
MDELEPQVGTADSSDYTDRLFNASKELINIANYY